MSTISSGCVYTGQMRRKYADGIFFLRKSTIIMYQPNALQGLDILLRPGQLLRLAKARHYRIHCHAGHAWITAPGEFSDIYLSPGEDWLVSNNGRILIEALAQSVVSLEKNSHRNSAEHRSILGNTLGIPPGNLPNPR